MQPISLSAPAEVRCMCFLEGTLEIPQIPQTKTEADLRCNSQLELPVDLTR